MKTVPITQVDAFTDRAFGGNPAGVVLDAAGLDDRQMQAIAGEMNLSETAFLFPAATASGETPRADYRLRWFTPKTEVDFCGHATVATVHALRESGRLRDGRVTFQIRPGLLPVTVEGDWIWLEPAVPKLTPVEGALDEILAALGIEAGHLADWAPPVMGGERDLILPCRTLGVLRDARPDFARLAALGRSRGWRGYCLTTLETIEPATRTIHSGLPASSLHSRFFAPQFGIEEDPVTGSVHASLAVYVTGARRDFPERFIAEQGDLMGRPGRLRIEVERDGPAASPRRVRVGGQAVTVLRGELLLDAPAARSIRSGLPGRG